MFNKDISNNIFTIDEAAIKKTIGKNIAYLIRSNEINRKDLLIPFGFQNDRTIRNWENAAGRSTPSIFQLLTISKLFGVSVNELMEKDIEKESAKSEEEFIKKYAKPISEIITKLLLGKQEIWDYLSEKDPDFFKRFNRNAVEKAYYDDCMVSAKELEDKGQFYEAYEYYKSALLRFKNSESGFAAIRCLRKEQDKQFEDIYNMDFASYIEEQKNYKRQEYINLRDSILKNDPHADVNKVIPGLSDPDEIEKLVNYNYPESMYETIKTGLYIDATEVCENLDKEILSIKEWIMTEIYKIESDVDIQDIYWDEDYHNKIWNPAGGTL